LRFIGDRRVRTVRGARAYIEKGPMAMYAQPGLGLHVTELSATQTPIGLCGLIKRAGLDDVDIGFALLPAFRGSGYAHEAAAAVLAYGRATLGLSRIVAIATPDNIDSIRLLERLGLRFERMIRLADDDAPLQLHAWTA
jgi:[ribosomal protein S5]-alanine N-acetyltransferase